MPADPRITVLRADLSKQLSLPRSVDELAACVVMAPPYSVFARCLALTAWYVDVWTLCPPPALPLAASYGLREVGCVDGDAFDPPSVGEHHIVVRGPFARGLL